MTLSSESSPSPVRAPLLSPVTALAATTTVSYGVLFYGYGVLLIPMEQDLGWSRTFLSGVFSAALIVAAVFTFVVGRHLDSRPPRPVFLTGAVCGAVLTAVWGTQTNKVGFALVWLLLGLCQAVLFYDPAFTVLTKWLDGHARNRALTTVTLFAGLASTIFGPLTAYLERTVGWRSAVWVLAGLLAAATVPAIAIGLRRPITADLSSSTAFSDGPDGSPSSTSTRTIVRSFEFRMLSIAYVLSGFTTYGVAVHLVPFLRGRGLSGGVAAAALGAVGFVQVLGRALFTRLISRRSPTHLGTWVLLAKGLGLLVLIVVPGTAGVVLFVSVYGPANGLATLTRATSVSELYGASAYGALNAAVASATAIAGACAPFVVAAAISSTGSQVATWAGLAAVAATAAVANSFVARGVVRAAPTCVQDRVSELAKPLP